MVTRGVYRGRVRFGWIGGQRERVRGEYRGRYLSSKKKEGKFAS